MANFVAALVAIVITAVFVLVYMNRASAEVVGAAGPVLLTAISALTLVFVFGKPAAIQRTFPVVFIAQKVDQAPILLPHRTFDVTTLAMFDGCRSLFVISHLRADLMQLAS